MRDGLPTVRNLVVTATPLSLSAGVAPQTDRSPAVPRAEGGRGRGDTQVWLAGWLAPATYKVGVTGLLFYLQQILTWPQPTLPPTQEKLMQATRIYSLNYASKCSTSQTGKNTEMKMSIIFQYSIFYMCCLVSSV